jgi:hypothetical protein
LDLSVIGSALAGGAIAGAIYGATGYLKAKAKDDVEFSDFEFDWVTFSTTVIGSGAVGAVSVYYGVPFDVFSTSAMGVAVTQLVKKFFGLAFAWFKKYEASQLSLKK